MRVHSLIFFTLFLLVGIMPIPFSFFKRGVDTSTVARPTTAFQTTGASANTNNGMGVASSGNGNFFVVVTPGYNSGTGRVVLYNGSTRGVLATYDASVAGANLGLASVSMSSDGAFTVLSAEAANNYRGLIYSLYWNGSTWTATSFGSPVPGDYSYFGKHAVISSDSNYLLGEDKEAGSDVVQSYLRSGQTWGSMTTIRTHEGQSFGFGTYKNVIAGDASFAAIRSGSNFGGSGYTRFVEISKRTGNTWSWVQTLSPYEAGADLDGAWAGAMSFDNTGTYLAIGSPQATSNAITQNGAVYIYKRTGDTYSFTQKIYPPTNRTNGWFGQSISMSGDGYNLIVGWPGYNTDQGGVVYYRRTNEVWTSQQTYPGLTPTASEKCTYGFGNTTTGISTTGNKLIFGCPEYSSGTGRSFYYY